MAKHILQTFLEEYDLPVRNYSGRGMGGRYCLGVETGDRDLLKVIFDIGHALGYEAGEERGCEQNRQDIYRALADARQDSMGLGVITYFPKVEFIEEDDESSEDDACSDCELPFSKCQCESTGHG